ncbi:type IV secretory pathway VirB4 component [Catenuloplanes nepalensis]|uniref:Type IV secretory pathway VirB4 component n=1 Tax=Catenuloplanes nepalensis TaxID=587533 RepID=A0ABT9MMC2_9ACTN|nr:hypothetical protein [Catenuloplanes nepalensis]MDP9792569.1 type IV secretory pathway VirB4 component [Catenuloplanes nepalensis]
MIRRNRLPREDSLTALIGERAAAADAAAAARQARRRQRRLDRDTARLTGPPPAGARGGSGPAAGRAVWQLRLPPLETTSAQLCSVYPFVTDPGLPALGPLIGTEVYSKAAFYFSVHELYRLGVVGAPNMVVTGEIRSAKSSLLKSLAFRNAALGRRSYIVDVKGEYDPLADALGIRPLRIGPGLGVVMNPLAGISRLPGQSETEWAQVQRTRRLLLLEGLLEIQVGDRLTEAERSLIAYALDAVTRTDDGTDPGRQPAPTLSTVLAAMADADAWQHRLAGVYYTLSDFVADSRRVRLALERLITGALGGIFDAPDTVSARLDFAQPGAVLDLRAVRTSDAMTAMAMTCAQSWLEAELTRPGAPPRMCLYDEFALLARYIGPMRRMREQLKLARALGSENILAFHRFSDLAASGHAGSEQVRIARGLIEDTGVRISYRQAAGSLDSAAEFLGTTDVETQLLQRLKRGTGLWKVAGRSYVVKHQLSRVEWEMVNTEQRMLGDGPAPPPAATTGVGVPV